MITDQKEKAKELFDMFYVSKMSTNYFRKEEAKSSAIICAEQILASSPSLPILSENGSFASDIEESTKFWKEVIKELEKS